MLIAVEVDREIPVLDSSGCNAAFRELVDGKPKRVSCAHLIDTDQSNHRLGDGVYAAVAASSVVVNLGDADILVSNG